MSTSQAGTNWLDLASMSCRSRLVRVLGLGSEVAFGGGKLEHPRQWPGARWTGRPLAWER